MQSNHAPKRRPTARTRIMTRRVPTPRADARRGRGRIDTTLVATLATGMVAATVVVSTLVASLAPVPTEVATASEDLVGIEVTMGESRDGWDEGQGDGEGLALALYGEPDISGYCPVVWYPQDDGSFVNTDGAWLGAENAFGVDVSEWNGWVDWEVAQACGVDFAMIRCGVAYDDAYYDDEMWEYNASECERLGIPYGVYLYSYATTVDGVYSEAAHVVRLLEGHSPTMGVWYDVEEAEQAAVLDYDPETFNMFMDIFADEVEDATGCRTGIYASASWFSTHLSEIADRGRHPIWVACWADYEPTELDHVCWQAGAALIPGFGSQVDFNVISA